MILKKFIIIDPSFLTTKKYNFKDTLELGKAVALLGYQPIIIGNKVLSQELKREKSMENIKIIPAFEIDWLNHSTINNQLPFWQKNLQKITSFFQNLSLENIRANISTKIAYKLLFLEITKPKFALLIEKIKGSTFRLKNWWEKDLNLLQYIPFSNTIWGLSKIFFGSFRFFIVIIIKIISKIWLKLFNFQPESFIKTLTKTCQTIKVSPEDHIFIDIKEIFVIEELLYYLQSQDLATLPNYHLILTKDIKNYDINQEKNINLQRCLNLFYESQLWSKKVKFYTNTENLLELYNSLSPVKFLNIPIPFCQEKFSSNIKLRQKNEPLNIVYLGETNKPQGYHLLPDIIANLYSDYIVTNKIKFTIQSHLDIKIEKTELIKAKLQLEQYPEEQVKLINKVMDSDSYYQLLTQADLILFPYDNNYYISENCLHFSNALAMGKSVIIPENTWLAKQVDETRAITYNNPKYITEAIIKGVNNLERLTKNALEFSLTWKNNNNYDTFLKELLKEPNFTTIKESKKVDLSSKKSIPKILYIIDGDCLLNQDINSENIIKNLQYLSQCGYEIKTIFYTINSNYSQDNFHQFIVKVKEIIKDNFFKENWFINLNSLVTFLADSDKNKYVQEVAKNKLSLSRNLIDVNSLNISPSLISNLQANRFDLIFIDNIASEILVEKLGLEKIPLIYQMSDLYSYHYAIKNNQELDNNEFKKECELLAKCQVILCEKEYQGKKLETIISSSKIYYLPNTHSLNKKVSLPPDNKNINWLKSSTINEYEKLMNMMLINILGEKVLTINNLEKSKKIAILYPWEDILERKAGASKRVGLLIDYLISENHQIWLFTTGRKREILDKRIRYTFYEQNFANLSLVKQVYANSYQTFFESTKLLNQSKQIDEINPANLKNITEDWRLSMYNQFRFDSNFKQWIEEISDWADVIILEYPFWAKTVSKMCQEKQIKLIITAHDAIYKQVKENTIISQLLLTEEITSLQTANQVVFVSEEDQQLFNEYNLNSLVIPNPVKLQNKDFNEYEKIPLELLNKYNWLTENFCLFVGSNHFPNLEAVKEIREIAYQYSQKQEQEKCKFIIVGSCCLPEKINNFIALGKVEFDFLTLLYQQANLILSPMLSGTGSSLKVMEAMAYGKVILGTKIAFRGYPIESERHCIILDEMKKYPDKINQLLSSSEKIKIIGENAKQLAQKYDYRHLYKSYQQIINKC